MDKNEAIEIFLRTLKVSLTTTSVYFKGHPNFIKSVDELYENLNQIFSFLNLIKITVAVNSLFVEDKYFKKSKTYEDLASILHRRKIKHIAIKQGITKEELTAFLLSVGLSTQEIIQNGGLKNILIKENCQHIDITDLDYSYLLSKEGASNKTTLAAVLEEIIEEDNSEKINEFVSNFQEFLKKAHPQDFIKDKKLNDSLKAFLAYLEAKEEEKFKDCSKDILKLILQDKNISSQEDIRELNVFLRGLSRDDLADVLWDEILTNENFDTLSFNLFFKLVGQKQQEGIIGSLAIRKKNDLSKLNLDARKKIKELFSFPEGLTFDKVYRQAFDFLLKSITFEEKGFSFDASSIYLNYRFMLLNLFTQEEDRDKLYLIKEKLLSQWQNIIDDNDFEYFKYLQEFINKKSFPVLAQKDIYDELSLRISNTVENIAFSKEAYFDISWLVPLLVKSNYSVCDYINKIFKEEIVNQVVLKLFFKFYPEEFPLFCDRLNKRGPDIEFSVKIIDAVKKITSPFVLDTLKTIFYFSNNFVKIEILKAMQELQNVDQEFLADLLEKEGLLLKRQVLLILKNKNLITKEIIDLLFSSANKFRGKSILFENLELVDELKLVYAEDNLIKLSKKRFFWNRNLRKKAEQALKKLKC